jgi:hypothetical protein
VFIFFNNDADFKKNKTFTGKNEAACISLSAFVIELEVIKGLAFICISDECAFS